MKKIFKGLGLFCLSVAVAIGSFFVTKKETKTHIASADSITSDFSYTGSNLFFNVYPGYYDKFLILNYNVKFVKNSANTLFFDVSESKLFTPYSLSNSDMWSASVRIASDYNSVVNNTGSTSFNLVSDNANHFILLYGIYTDLDGSNKYSVTDMYYNCSSSFNCNVVSIRLYHDDDLVIDSIKGFNVITYSDNNNNTFSVYFRYGSRFSSLIKLLKFEDRTYFLTPDLTDSQQYNQGYQQGLADNQQNIYNSGYNAGKIVGYNNGKTDGIASANNYSFIGLIGAVFDAPLQTFKGLLNFNILGINLLDFALSLITIALVVYIIRLIKGGR